MSAAPLLPPDAIPGTRRKYFTRQEVERMLASGALDGQRLELIDGQLFDKMGQKPPHAAAIRLLTKLLATVFELELIQIQLPIEAGDADRDRTLPEPDLAVLRERNTEFRLRHPRGDELVLAIEVSDTTIAFDLSRKAQIYANAGVPEYWVIDLNRRRVVAHRNPVAGAYQSVQPFAAGELVPIAGQTLPVDEIFPE
jgi:Uma2 family endonuclease